jgi:DNA-directed RNA polymerase specialized sigma subunit
MTAKEFLWQYLNAQREIDAKLDKIRKLREQATKITTTLNPDKVQSTQGNNMERAIMQIIEMSEEIEGSVNLLRETQKRVNEAIQGVGDSLQRTVLYRRYINGEKFEEIAVNMNYSYKQVCRIHGKALDEINHVLACPIEL